MSTLGVVKGSVIAARAVSYWQAIDSEGTSEKSVTASGVSSCSLSQVTELYGAIVGAEEEKGSLSLVLACYEDCGALLRFARVPLTRPITAISTGSGEMTKKLSARFASTANGRLHQQHWPLSSSLPSSASTHSLVIR